MYLTASQVMHADLSQRELQLKFTEITFIAHDQSQNHFFFLISKGDISTWLQSFTKKFQKNSKVSSVLFNASQWNRGVSPEELRLNLTQQVFVSLPYWTRAKTFPAQHCCENKTGQSLNIHCRTFTHNSACTAHTSSSYKPKKGYYVQCSTALNMKGCWSWVRERVMTPE